MVMDDDSSTLGLSSVWHQVSTWNIVDYSSDSQRHILLPFTHCGLVTPYGDIDPGQHWLRWWLVAWRHQAITWTNVDLSSIRSSDIHLRSILWKVSQPSIIEISLKITYLKFHSNFPGVNELTLKKSDIFPSRKHMRNLFLLFCPGASELILVMLRLEYSWRTWSRLRLLITWLLASPGHQLRLHRINGFLSCKFHKDRFQLSAPSNCWEKENVLPCSARKELTHCGCHVSSY